MEIKYEAVFGPQELFDGAPDDAEMAYETANHVRGYYKKCNSLKFFSNSKWVRVLNEKAMIIHAMRRIIRTPTWTVADKKAGKLPEVGCRVFDVTNENEATVKAINKRQVCLESIDGFIYLLPPDDIKPIESTEEKAARLRKEWCVAASKQLKNLEYNSTLTSIYDALLSGDLPVPAKGE